MIENRIRKAENELPTYPRIFVDNDALAFFDV